MDIELDQFQKDLLESVREINASHVVCASEDRSLQMQECADANALPSSKRRIDVSLKLENGDT